MIDPHSCERLDFQRIRELIASLAASGLGKRLAEHIEPVTKPELIRRWLNQVRELLELAEDRGLPPFGGISDVRALIERCAPPLRVTVEQMAEIGSTLAGTKTVSQYLADLTPEKFPELQHLAERLGDFSPLSEKIARVIDPRGMVRDDASPKLLRIRRQIEESAAGIRETVEKLLRDPGVRRLLQYANYTFHNDRMVLPLRTEYRGRLPGIIHRHSDSGATLYVEPAQAVELNNQVTNLRSEEEEEIGRLLWELCHEIHLNEGEIRRTLDTLAVLDLMTAKARYAKTYRARVPDITDEGRLNVRGARHPLLVEMVHRRNEAGEFVEPIVPIDYRLGDDFDMLIVTGPNTGGKTVALKTVGLISLMAQAGLPVTVAEGSTIGIFANVLIDIGDEQSMQQSLSTFSAHLRRMLEMLRRAGPKTLVLIDELGAGTDPDEGAAIGRAILDDLLRLECRCITTTHLGALKGFALTRPRAENARVEFDVETLRPTYHLRIGEAGQSNAIEIAQRLGMPKRLVVAARHNLSRGARQIRAVLADTSEVKRQAESARSEAETARLAAERAAHEANEARVRFERQQHDFQTWVQRVVHLRPGDAVRVRGFDRDGKIVRMRIDHHRAEVNVGAFTIEVPLGDVLPPETPPPPPRSQPASPDAGMTGIGRARREGRRGGPGTAPPSGGSSGAGPQGGKDGVHTRGPGTGRRDAGRGEPQPGREPQRGPGQREQAARGPGGRGGDRDERRGPPLIPLTDEDAAKLTPGDEVFAKRFHRAGRIVRIKLEKKIAIVTVGVLEVEVPFSGLARVAPKPPREAPRKPAAAVPPASTAGDSSTSGDSSDQSSSPVSSEAAATTIGDTISAALPPAQEQSPA